jgi:hypothetical protein
LLQGSNVLLDALLDQSFSICWHHDRVNAQPIEVLLVVHVLVRRQQDIESSIIGGTKQLAILDVCPRGVDEWGAVMTEIGASDSAVRQSSFVIEWAARMLGEAKAVDLAAVGQALKSRRSVGWTWSSP